MDSDIVAKYTEMKKLYDEYATEMTFTGRPMKGMLYIDSDGIAQDEDLHYWIDCCLKFVASLPDKKKKKK